MKLIPIAAALSALLSGPALAEEVNPFSGAHGKVEELRLNTDTTAQENKLVLEKIELLKNKNLLRELEDGGTPADAQAKSLQQVGGAMGALFGGVIQQAQKAAGQTEPPKQETQPPPPPPPVVKTKPPLAEMKLSGVIAADSGLTAVITQGERTWTVSRGDRVGKATVTRITPDQVTLSSGKRLSLAEGEFPVSNGEVMLASAKPRMGGAPANLPAMPLGDEMRAIMNVTGAPQPNGGPAIQAGAPPAPAVIK